MATASIGAYTPNAFTASAMPRSAAVPKSDRDGDKDMSVRGEVESREYKKPAMPNPTATMGNNVNVRA